LRYGFEVLAHERLYARTDLPNQASRRVMERAGMRFDGRSDEGAFGGLVRYVMTSDDLKEAK
jgi:RimJ/RimL family protein N-acetyltransferase